MEYLKVNVSFREVIKPLSAVEKGRLFDAMLEYAESGTEQELHGNERFAWLNAKTMIDLTAKKHTIYQENGRKGGAPSGNQNAKKTTKNNLIQPNSTNNNQNQAKTTNPSPPSSPPSSPSPGPLSSPPTTPPIIPRTPSPLSSPIPTPSKGNAPKPPKGGGASEDITRVVEFLNARVGTHYKASSEVTRKHIRARMAEGFTVEDFQTVIRKKCDEWRGTDMEKFLRPETLFGTKFESYLNSPARAAKKEVRVGPNGIRIADGPSDLDDIF